VTVVVMEMKIILDLIPSCPHTKKTPIYSQNEFQLVSYDVVDTASVNHNCPGMLLPV